MSIQAFKIRLPLKVIIPRKTMDDKEWILNLNNYRVMAGRKRGHMQLNEMKHLYAEQVGGLLIDIKSLGIEPPYEFIYVLFHGTNRLFDVENPGAVISKFTSDALTKSGLISDDNYKVIGEVRHRFGGVDKLDPRCDLYIRPLQPLDI